MNILITGASGFVGPYLATVLNEKYPESSIWGTYFLHHEFHHIDQRFLIPYQLDLQNLNSIKFALKEIKPDSIYHLAAQSSVGKSWKNPSVTFNVNVNGSINLLDAIREYNPDIPVIISGSSEQYGKIGNEVVAESDICEPLNPYGISKMSMEKMAGLYVKAYGMNIRLTRSFNHIGPGQEESFVISDWSKQIALIEKSNMIPVISVGNIDVVRDFSHVEDVCKAYIDILEKGKSGEVYNVGSGNSYSLKELLTELLSLSSTDIQIKIDPEKIRPAENPVIRCNRTKLDSISSCKFRPIEAALEDVLDSWRLKITSEGTV